MNKIFLLPVLLLTLCQAAAQEFCVKAENAVIAAVSSETAAAAELKTHLEWITGKKFSIKNVQNIKKGTFVFYVGKAPTGAEKKFFPEEARWEITPDAAYFYGDKNNGTLFAVYAFLENELGIRWPSAQDIAGKKQDPLKLRTVKGKWCPQLNLRIVRSGRDKSHALQWRKRLRMGAHDRPSYGHAFVKYWQRFSKTHPEFFAMRKDGVRAPIGAKGNSANAAAFKGKSSEAIAMCVSSDGLIDQIIADWKNKGCPLYINLCENDALGKDSCHCKECTALDVVPQKKSQWENWYADRYVYFAGKVLKRARKIRKDVKVAMYAYNASEQAPKREVPDENLVIGIVPTDFTKKGIEAYVGSWKRAGMKHFFYRPNRYYYYNLPQLPFGYEKHFFEIWQYLYKSGAIGFDYDSDAEKSIFEYFGNYVLLKAMQEPERSFEYWENHYMQSFGNAREDIRQYYRYWREQVWEKRLAPNQREIAEKGKVFNFGRGLVWNLGSYYKESDFVSAGKHFASALSRDLTAEERRRIERLQLANEHARLFFNAVAGKNDAASLKLLAFREKHKIPLLPWNEQYYGDICGIKRVMNFKDYKIPYLKTNLFWHFRLDPQNKGVSEKWFADSAQQVRRWGNVMCTNTPWETPHRHYKQISNALRKETANYDGIAWYGTQIKVPANWKERKVFLYFGAVDESCRVYVNGKLAGMRIFKNNNDWSTPFAIEITSAVDWKKKEQNVIVQVEDNAGQGGIWKPVWLVSK